jgi:hypothetical protein
MKNIFEKYETTRNYFNENLLKYILSISLDSYLFDNLEGENYQTFRWNLQEALKNNVNE